ncbi:MAG: DUF2975 domain-containing protein [Algibacter sp.]
MKTISTLKKLINFYFYFLVFGFIAIPIAAIIHFNNDTFTSIFFFKDYDLSNSHRGVILTIILIGELIYYQFIKVVYLLKNSLNDLSDGHYFSDLIVHNFKKIGRLSIIWGVVFSVYEFLSRFLIVHEMRLVINNTLLISIITGLFFMFLSEAFAKANLAKQENDLTI